MSKEKNLLKKITNELLNNSFGYLVYGEIVFILENYCLLAEQLQSKQGSEKVMINDLIDNYYYDIENIHKLYINSDYEIFDKHNMEKLIYSYTKR